MKDINLLPDEIKRSANTSKMLKVGKAVSEGTEGVKELVEAMASKVSSGKGTGVITNISKNLKDSIVESIQDKQERAASFLHSLKKDKIRNLEKLLDVN